MFTFAVAIDDNVSGRVVSVRKQYPDAPSWDQLAEVFMDALKAEGYCFKPNSVFAVHQLDHAGDDYSFDEEQHYPHGIE